MTLETLLPGRFGGDSSGDEVAIGVDVEDVCELLRSDRRQAVVRILDQHGALDQDELVDRVAVREFSVPMGTIRGKRRKRVYVALQQSHLSKLASAGVIGRDRAVVRRGPVFDVYVRALEALEEALGR